MTQHHNPLPSVAPRSPSQVTSCECGSSIVRFDFDQLGRTVEICDECGYKGPQRNQSGLIPERGPRRCSKCHKTGIAFYASRGNICTKCEAASKRRRQRESKVRARIRSCNLCSRDNLTRDDFYNTRTSCKECDKKAATRYRREMRARRMAS